MLEEDAGLQAPAQPEAVRDFTKRTRSLSEWETDRQREKQQECPVTVPSYSPRNLRGF